MKCEFYYDKNSYSYVFCIDAVSGGVLPVGEIMIGY